MRQGNASYAPGKGNWNTFFERKQGKFDEWHSVPLLRESFDEKFLTVTQCRTRSPGVAIAIGVGSYFCTLFVGCHLLIFLFLVAYLSFCFCRVAFTSSRFVAIASGFLRSTLGSEAFC